MSHKKVMIEIQERMLYIKNGIGDSVLSIDKNGRITIIFNSYDYENDVVKKWELTIKEIQ